MHKARLTQERQHRSGEQGEGNPDVVWPTACAQDDILMFGGSGGRESRPQYVPNEWSVATEFLKDATGTVRCACMPI